MTEAVRDHQPAGAEAPEQAETDERRVLQIWGPGGAPARPTSGVGIPPAEAEILGEYNLYNG